MIKRILILFLLFQVKPCLSQSGFHKLYTTSSPTYGQDICKINEQRFAVVGKTLDSLANFFRAYILLTNENGDTLWSRIFQSTENMNAISVMLSPDSNLIIGGTIGGGIFFIKIDTSGNLLSSKTIRQTPLFFVDPRFSILPDSGLMAGAVVSSLPNYSSALLRLDKDFNVIWGRYYSYDIFFRDLVCDTSGTVICGDKTTGINLFKVSPFGNILWNKRYDFGRDVQCRFINKTFSNEFLIGGKIDNFNLPYFVGGFLIKADFEGNNLWSRIYFPGVPELFNSTNLTNNRFAIYSIHPYYNSFNTTMFVTDSNGVTQWAKSYKTYNNFSQFAGVSTNNDDYLIAASGKRPDLGQNTTSAYLIKTDSQGNSSCSDTTIALMDSIYNLAEDVWSISDTIANLSSQNLNLTINSNFSIYDICNSIITVDSKLDISHNELVYPNPFRDEINIESDISLAEKPTLTIYNFSGLCILKMQLQAGTNKIDLSAFSNGIYHINVKGLSKHWSKNIVKL